jgi:hypothetical protein
LWVLQIYKAKRVAMMKMADSGFEDKLKSRKELKLKALMEKGLLSPTKLKGRKRKKLV